MRFIDEVRVQAFSGAGGPGLAAFRKEKYLPNGGPWGGDGGKGGDVVFVATRDKNTLLHLRFNQQLRAKNGVPGGTARKTGAGGADVVVEVPVGTIARDADTGEVLADLTEHGQRVVLLAGGIGGLGNARFKTSTNRAPTHAQPGRPGASAHIALELKLMADVGLLGYPNAGKSTLISRLSAAKPKVAGYPFTTLVPSLGVVRIPGSYDSFVMADIPGLIEGAADGAGLGHQFLRHVERCSLLLHMVSLDPMETEAQGEPLDRFARINHELKRFDPALAERPQVVLLSKADLCSDEDAAAVRDAFSAEGHAVHIASAATNTGLDPLVYDLAARLESGAPS